MSSISNRFYVTALEDGTTLHGNLASDKSLSQAWNGSAALPDWTIAENQPTIYITLLSGSTLVVPDNTGKWYYNDQGTESEITDADTRFQITTKSITYAEQTATVPALKIVANLASSSNVNVDSIIYKGSYTINGSAISFSAVAQIRITSVSKGSNVGVINFVNGISDITSAGQTITLYATCFGGDNGSPVSGFTTTWYINDTQVPAGSPKITTYNSYPALNITEGDVVDHATIRCEFYKGGELLDTAYAGVDDMQDPEFMYIQYNGNNGNAASLRTGESAPFIVFVGSRDSATVRTGWEGAVYKVQLLDGNGDIITASSLNNIPNPDAGDTTNYYRTLEKYASNYQDENLRNKAHFEVNYSVPAAYGKNITGIIIAYSS